MRAENWKCEVWRREKRDDTAIGTVRAYIQFFHIRNPESNHSLAGHACGAATFSKSHGTEEIQSKNGKEWPLSEQHGCRAANAVDRPGSFEQDKGRPGVHAQAALASGRARGGKAPRAGQYLEQRHTPRCALRYVQLGVWGIVG